MCEIGGYMSKRERWLSSVALVMSTIPLILTVILLKIIPDSVELIPNNLDDSGPNNLFAGFLSIIPFFIVIGSRYIKRKVVVYRNFSTINIVAIVLSLLFTFVIGFCVARQINKLEEIIYTDLDYIGLSCVIISLFISISGNALRYRNVNSKIALRNKYTKKSVSVFKVVHQNASVVATFLFAILAIVLAFIHNYYALITLCSVIFAYLCWIYLHSYLVYNKFLKSRGLAIDIA